VKLASLLLLPAAATNRISGRAGEGLRQPRLRDLVVLAGDRLALGRGLADAALLQVGLDVGDVAASSSC
jgi:hypothetical protein